MRKDFLELEKQGIVRRSTSPWSSPLLVLKKPDGSYRSCGDYRRLNNVTVKDRYNLPLLRDFQHLLAGKKVFSSIDLTKAYYQINVAKDSIPKTAVITPFGLWVFLKLPFGVCNAVPTFQKTIDAIFSDFDFIFCYLDDILIFSENEEEHVQHVRAVLQRLREFGLCANPKKSVFFKTELNFLGHQVSASGEIPGSC